MSDDESRRELSERIARLERQQDAMRERIQELQLEATGRYMETTAAVERLGDKIDALSSDRQERDADFAKLLKTLEDAAKPDEAKEPPSKFVMLMREPVVQTLVMLVVAAIIGLMASGSMTLQDLTNAVRGDPPPITTENTQ